MPTHSCGLSSLSPQQFRHSSGHPEVVPTWPALPSWLLGWTGVPLPFPRADSTRHREQGAGKRGSQSSGSCPFVPSDAQRGIPGSPAVSFEGPILHGSCVVFLVCKSVFLYVEENNFLDTNRYYCIKLS